MSTFQKVIKYASITLAVFLTVGILSGIVGVISGVISIFSNGEDEYKLNYVKDFTDVEQLDISNGVGEITIRPGDGFKVEGRNVSKNFKAYVNNGTLIVEEKDSDKKFFWFIFGSGNNKSSVTVYVPSDFNAKKIKIDSGTGKITLEDLSTDYLQINGGVGEINGQNITAKAVKAKGGVGDMTFRDVNFTDVDFDNGVGDLEIDGIIIGKSEFECGVGNIKLNINGNRKDYALIFDDNLGSIRVNGQKVSSEYRDSFSAKHTISIDGGVGDVKIDFKY